MSQTKAQLVDGFNINTSVPADSFVIDSSGNVGIGTTSPFSDAQLTVDNGGSGDAAIAFSRSAAGQNDVALVNTSGEFIVKNGVASTVSGLDERLRIDSSGRLLVGTSSSLRSSALAQIAGTNYPGFDINSFGSSSFCELALRQARGTQGSPTVVASGDTVGVVYFQGYDGADHITAATIQANIDATPGSNDMPGRLVFSTTADGSSSPTERMRIKSNGFTELANDGTIANGNSHVIRNSLNTDTLFVRASNASYSNLIVRAAASRNTNDNTYYFYNAVREGVANVFYVADSGNVTNANNSYGSISDIKLKQDIEDAESQWDDIKALKVRKYRFKSDPNGFMQMGLIAQEAEAISPGLIDEHLDRETIEVPVLDSDGGVVLDENGNEITETQEQLTGTTTKAIKYSVLYMKAFKALQEAMERIETLEQRLNDAGIA